LRTARTVDRTDMSAMKSCKRYITPTDNSSRQLTTKLTWLSVGDAMLLYKVNDRRWRSQELHHGANEARVPQIRQTTVYLSSRLQHIVTTSVCITDLHLNVGGCCYTTRELLIKNYSTCPPGPTESPIAVSARIVTVRQTDLSLPNTPYIAGRKSISVWEIF